MFKPDDVGQWEFRPQEATVVWIPHDTKAIPAARSVCHVRMGFELIERELQQAPPSLWTIQIYAGRDTNGKASLTDPLGQREGNPIPVVSIYFSRRNDDKSRFLVQHMDQYGELTTPAEVMEQLKTAVARWMMEGLS